MPKKNLKSGDKSPQKVIAEKQKETQLEHLIEETLMEAYLSKDIIEDLKGESHDHSEVFIEDIEIKPPAKKGLKIPGVRKEDGSDCCGGGCCTLPTDQSQWQAELSKKEYLDIINQVLDPETGVGITDMGLIYDVEEHKDGLIVVTMTLTSMGCPAGGQITTEIDAMLRLQPHVTDVKIEVVWEPAWNPEMMNPDVKAMLFGDNTPEVLR